MSKKKTLNVLMVILASVLVSGTAVAQLSLSADAEAKADGDGAAAEGDAGAEGPTEAAPAEPAPAPIVESAIPIADEADGGATGNAGYDNGFFIKTDDDKFKLVIHGMAKTRYTFYNDEYAVIGNNGDPGTNHTMHSNFAMPYARIHLSGNMFTKKLGYVIYHDFAVNALQYAYATWTFIPEKLVIQVGQFKRPFSRAYLTSSVKRQFIHAPLGETYRTNLGPWGGYPPATAMGRAIDVGIQVSNNYMKAKGLEWAVAVMNGSVGGAWTDFSPSLIGRIGYNNGIKGYSETDFEGGGLRWGVALSASTEFDHDDDDTTQHYVSLDGILKIQGLSLSAAGYIESVAEDFVWDVPAGAGLSHIGAFVGAGYLIKFLEPVVRYGMIHDYNANDDLQQEITAGLSLHFLKNHNFKWENNFTLFLDNEPNATATENEMHLDMMFSSQLQFYF